jgi:hypothetical protein
MTKPPIKISLDREDIAKMPDPIFRYLIDVMVDKAAKEGYDMLNSDDLVFGNWRIKCEIVKIS